MTDSTQRVLVVADRTADSPDLIEELCERATRSATDFTLLVPAVPHGLSWAADMTAGWPEAVARAERAADRIRAAGLPLEEVIVGDPDPFAAVGDALHARGFDAVVVSLLPRGVSRWLALGLPARLRRCLELPVYEVSASPAPPLQAQPPSAALAA